MSSLPILVLNSGSSSIKFSMYEAREDERRRLLEGAVEGIGTDQGKFWITDASGKKLMDQAPSLPSREVAFKLVADALSSGKFPAPAAIGHRMVSGGPTVLENQRVTPALIDEMERYTAFAPLHTPIASLLCARLSGSCRGVPNFVILDSYFHRTMPEVARHMPIPRRVFGDGCAAIWRTRHLLRVDCVPVATRRAGEVDCGAPGERRVDYCDSQWRKHRYVDGADSDRRHYQRQREPAISIPACCCLFCARLRRQRERGGCSRST